MQETQELWFPSLGQEDPLERAMALHSSALAWKIPWTEELAGEELAGKPMGPQSRTRPSD